MKKTKQPTEVAKAISVGKTQDDTVAKRLFSINEIIAWILKLCIEEFSTINVQDIVNEWLAKADKRIGTEPVLPDIPPRRSAVGTEDKSKTDGTVYFDFRTEIPLRMHRRWLRCLSSTWNCRMNIRNYLHCTKEVYIITVV